MNKYSLYSTAATCSFDAGLCGWLQSTSDNIDWRTGMGSTPSRNTGPHADHSGTSGGIFDCVIGISIYVFLSYISDLLIEHQLHVNCRRSIKLSSIQKYVRSCVTS